MNTHSVIQSQANYQPGADNDFINMSQMNILSILHPNRQINQDILKQYRWEHELRMKQSEELEKLRKDRQEKLKDQKEKEQQQV